MFKHVLLFPVIIGMAGIHQFVNVSVSLKIHDMTLSNNTWPKRRTAYIARTSNYFQMITYIVNCPQMSYPERRSGVCRLLQGKSPDSCLGQYTQEKLSEVSKYFAFYKNLFTVKSILVL